MLGSTAKRAAQFKTNSVADIRKLVAEALQSPNAKFYPNPEGGSFRIVTDMGYSVGTKNQTSIRVIVGDDGKIWNAFPQHTK